MINICNETDCPLYKQNSIQENYSTWDNLHKVIIQTEYINCNVECLFCKHRKSIDIKTEIIADIAKKALSQ